MRLHALLPAKEKYSAAHAGAVAMVVQDFLAHSAHRKTAIIVGSALDDAPLDETSYKAIKSWDRYVYGQNIGLARGYIRWVKSLSADARPDCIEVHGRCAVAGLIARALPDIPVILALHNDPRGMDGAKSVADRQKLVRALAGISAVSQYLLGCFQEGLTAEDIAQCGFYLTRFGMDRLHKAPPPKQKTILLVGRMVPEKGILQVAEAAAQCLPKFSNWRLKIVGARRFNNGRPTPYQNQVDAALASLGDQGALLGHLPISEVRRHQAGAAIILAPSQWEEPAGRVILEAFTAGAALISSNKGGIPEYAGHSAILLDSPDTEKIMRALTALLSHPTELKRWQDAAWQHQCLTVSEAAAIMDTARQDCVDGFLKSRHASN